MKVFFLNSAYWKKKKKVWSQVTMEKGAGFISVGQELFSKQFQLFGDKQNSS